MNKSIYENYADTQQPMLLSKTKTLEDMVQHIRELKSCRSADYIEALEEYVSDLYNINCESVRRLVDEVEYWLT